jgi:Holliday junction DNA helicase RuvB
MAGILTYLQPRDVLWIEDIDRLNAVVAEILLRAMEDFRLDVLIGEGPMARNVTVDLPPFTLVGTTSRPGNLSDGLRAHFGITVRLDPYDEQTIGKLIQVEAERIGVRITPEAVAAIAAQASGSPGEARRLLPRVADFAHADGRDTIDSEIAAKALGRLVDTPGPAATRREPIAEDVRTYVWRRDQGRCVRCGSNTKLEFDHIIPVIEGGGSTARNIQLLCEPCNRSKGKTI